MIILYVLVLILLSIYSYALVDPNFTLINHPLWETFRNFMVNLGYYDRPTSLIFYLVIVTLLLVFNYYWSKSQYSPTKLAIIVSGCLLLSYPFLSHDFFNYLFDARIVTFYGKNPYFFKALDFPLDPWLRFMHWTHRTYPYGPSFLLLTLVPSALSLGKFVLNFVFFKFLFLGIYVAATYFLSKFSRKSALFFATSPLILIEGLVNSHNDLLGVSLFIISLGLVLKKRRYFWGVLMGVLSVGIKYFTLALMPLFIREKKMLILSLILYFSILAFAYTRLGVHPWYFLNLAAYLPFVKKYGWNVYVLSAGLLLSYYPYILYGGWDESWKVDLKEMIIGTTLIIFLIGLWFECRDNLRHKAAASE